MFTVRGGEAHADAEIRQVRMGVMPTVEFSYRLGITLASVRLDQHAFLKVSLEDALQRHEKRRAIVTVPICVASRHNLGVVCTFTCGSLGSELYSASNNKFR